MAETMAVMVIVVSALYIGAYLLGRYGPGGRP